MSYWTTSSTSKACKLFMEQQIKSLKSSKPTDTGVSALPTKGPLLQIHSTCKKERIRLATIKNNILNYIKNPLNPIPGNPEFNYSVPLLRELLLDIGGSTRKTFAIPDVELIN